MYAELFAIIQ